MWQFFVCDLVVDHCKHAQNGLTALMHAARFGHVDCAQVLLEAGADKNAKTKVCFGLMTW